MEDVARTRIDLSEHAGSAMLAVGQIALAIDQGLPFQRPLQSLSALSEDGGGDDAAVLAAAAETGVVSLDSLQRRFPAMARAVRDAAVTEGTDNWLADALDRVQALVTVRTIPGEVAGDSADAVLARAENRLANGNLAGAVDALGALAGGPADAAGPWIRDAQARLDALAALDALADAALARAAAR